MTTHSTIGKPLPRLEGVEKTTGATRYVGDLTMPGMLWGRVLRSPHPYAKVLSIDTSKAKAIPGVHAVLTADDVPALLIGRKVRDMPLLAQDRVRFVGERVAVVAADSRELAEAAAHAIVVEYEELPAVFHPLDAMEPRAPLLHEGRAGYEGYSQPGEPAVRVFDEPGVVEPVDDHTNVIAHFSWDHGDVAKGFAEADRVFEHTYTTPRVHQAYLEPHSCLVWLEPDGHTHVIASNKAPFAVRRQLSLAVGLSEELISVHPIAVGGDFGGKGSFMDVPLAYHLAHASGRPVRMAMDHVEELSAANPRHPAVITIWTGVTRDGAITARQVRVVFNGGAYNALTPLMLPPLVKDAAGVYRIPNTRIDGYSVYTNTVPNGHFRGPGLAQVLFAEESHMDMIAHELELGPLEFRLKNLVRAGESSPLGEEWHDIRAEETVRAAADAIDWDAPKSSPWVGRGMSVSGHMCIGGPSGATLQLLDDGSFALLTSLVDTGTGAHLTIRQVVAEAMGVPLERVRLVSTDTDTANFEIGVSGSRITYTLGQVALEASHALRERLSEAAAHELDCDPAAVAFHGETVEADGRSMTLAELAGVAPPELTSASIDLSRNEPHVMGFVAQAAEVAVDPETGEVKVLRLVSAHDVGTVLNPIAHQGQIDGGLVQGLGYARMEELVFEDGRISTPTFADYKIPTEADVPAAETVLLESPTGEGPFSAKSIGEASIAGVAPAIANAVFDAIGVRITDLPVTAEKVHRALNRR